MVDKKLKFSMRKKGKLVWYSPAVGTAPQVAEVILERVREADGKPNSDSAC